MFIPARQNHLILRRRQSFNPATGLMFIPARMLTPMWGARLLFQSRDWVDVYSGNPSSTISTGLAMFQSRDWVDVYSGPARPQRAIC